MGQKVHPEIFKLSRTAGWKSKYFEKKSIETSNQVTKDIEVKKFVVQFFKQMGLTVNTCNLGYMAGKLNVFTSFTKKNIVIDGALLLCPQVRRKVNKRRLIIKRKKQLIKRKRRRIVATKFKLSKKILQTNFKKLIFVLSLDIAIKTCLFLTKFEQYTSFNKKDCKVLSLTTCAPAVEQKNYSSKKLRLIMNNTPVHGDPYTSTVLKNLIPDSRLYLLILLKALLKKSLSIIKTSCLLRKKARQFSVYSRKSLSVMRTREFQNERLRLKRRGKYLPYYKFMLLFFKSFSFFFKKTLNISLIFKCLNKKLKRTRPKTNILTLKKKLASLRGFSRNKFFKEGVNLMFLMASQKEAAEALASYITSSIKNFKKHKLFLKFIKKGLDSLAKRRKTVIKAIRIQLKGRINGADRARSYVIRVGERVSLLTLGSRINYFESTAFTPDGTLSVKVWIRYRSKLCEFKSKRLKNRSCEYLQIKQNTKKRVKVNWQS